MSTQVKNKKALIYKIPFSEPDRRELKETNVAPVYLNAKNEYSVGLHFCSSVLKVDFDIPVIDYYFGANGKPYLMHDKCGFSVSYTDDHVYIAIVEDALIGLDVEEVSDISLGVSQQFMSGKELRKLGEEEDKLEYFYKIWTLKEAYVKLIGTGINDSITDIEPAEDENGRLYLYNDKGDNVQFNNFVLNNVVFSLSSYVPLDYELIGFDSRETFFKKYVNKYSR